MASASHTVVVSVLGLSRLDGENFGSHKGIGKSCLCSRFMYPGYDDYQHDSHTHCSLLALHEFEGDVVHQDPFLYWGSTTKTYDAKGSSEKVQFEILEYTMFYQDITYQPFRINDSKKSVNNFGDYMNMALACKLDSSGKLSYKNRDLICIPEDYESVAFPSGIGKHRRGFVVVIDVSDEGPTFERRLHQMEKMTAHLASRKQKFVVAATKRDEAFASSLEKVNELARTSRFTLIEVSAKANVNVSEVFEIVAAKVFRKSKTINGLPTHVPSYSDANHKKLSTLDRTRRSFNTFLQKRVAVSSESLKALQSTEEYKTCAQLCGMFETNKIFAHHVLMLRNNEISTNADVMVNEETRQQFLEDYMTQRKDLSPHAKYLKELIINVCQTSNKGADKLLSPRSLTMQQNSPEEKNRSLLPIPFPMSEVNIPMSTAIEGNGFNMVPGENSSKEELHSHSVYDFISDGKEAQELDDDNEYVEIRGHTADVGSYESDEEVDTKEGRSIPDNHDYTYVRMISGVKSVTALHTKNDEYVNMTRTELSDEYLDMVCQPTAPLCQLNPQPHQPPAPLPASFSKLCQPFFEPQELFSPLQQSAQEEEEKGKQEQMLLTQGNISAANLDAVVVDQAESYLSMLGGTEDHEGREDSLTSPPPHPTKSPPQALQEKPLLVQNWTTNATITTSPVSERGTHSKVDSESDADKNPASCSTILNPMTFLTGLTAAYELPHKATPASASTVMFPETPGLVRITKKLQDTNETFPLKSEFLPVRDVQLESNMSLSSTYQSEIPAGVNHFATCNSSKNDFVLCSKCGISWVPLEKKSCLSDEELHSKCQICALSDLIRSMSFDDAADKETGRDTMIRNNPQVMSLSEEGHDDEDNSNDMYPSMNSCMENDRAGNEYVRMKEKNQHFYIPADASHSDQTSALQQLQPSPQLKLLFPQENKKQEKNEQTLQTVPTLMAPACLKIPDPAAIPLSRLGGAEESTQLSSHKLKKIFSPLRSSMSSILHRRSVRATGVIRATSSVDVYTNAHFDEFQ